MENVLSTVKTKVKTTKVLAILGVTLIILGLFFNVGKLYMQQTKEAKEASIESAESYLEGEELVKRKKEIEEDWKDSNKEAKKNAEEETLMSYWGGPVILILGVVALALAYVDFIKSKLPEETAAKIKFWDKLKNPKMILIPAIIILAILILTWKTPLKNEYLGEDNDSDDWKDLVEFVEEMKGKVVFSIGSGFVLVFLGAASLGAYPFLYKPEDTVAEAQPAEGNVDPIANNE